MIEPLLQAERALAVGLLDQAETLYAATVEADPRNAIAVVGLARVALERGDEERALRLGREALEIDAGNLVAQRLVGRLVEIREERAGSGHQPVAPSPEPPTLETPAGEPAPVGGAPEPAATPAAPTPAGPASTALSQPQPAPRRRGLVARLLGRR